MSSGKRKRVPDPSVRQPEPPRRQPQQGRSRALVAAILEAAARVFERRGFEHATTNEIAAVAGVGIGSLYQYFPSKEALLTALHEQHVDEVRTLLDDAFEAASSDTWEGALRRLVRAVLEAHAARPELQRLLHVQYRALEFDAPTSRAKQQLHERTRRWLAQHGVVLGIEDLDLAAHVILRQVEALVHAAVLDPIPGWTPELMEPAIVAAVQGYLERSRATPGAAPTGRARTTPGVAPSDGK